MELGSRRIPLAIVTAAFVGLTVAAYNLVDGRRWEAIGSGLIIGVWAGLFSWPLLQRRWLVAGLFLAASIAIVFWLNQAPTIEGID